VRDDVEEWKGREGLEIDTVQGVFKLWVELLHHFDCHPSEWPIEDDIITEAGCPVSTFALAMAFLILLQFRETFPDYIKENDGVQNEPGKHDYGQCLSVHVTPESHHITHCEENSDPNEIV